MVELDARDHRPEQAMTGDRRRLPADADRRRHVTVSARDPRGAGVLIDAPVMRSAARGRTGGSDPLPYLVRARAAFMRATASFHRFTASPNVTDGLAEIGSGHARAKIVVVP